MDFDLDNDTDDMSLMDYYMSVDIKYFSDFAYIKYIAKSLQIFYDITIIPCYILHGLLIYSLVKAFKTERTVSGSL